MLTYQSANSPFYKAHENYCKIIEAELIAKNKAYEGFCNSYGYDIFTKLEANGFTLNVNFHKHQTTRNGVLIPLNANSISDLYLNLDGLNSANQVMITNSRFKAWLLFVQKKHDLQNGFYLRCKMALSEKVLTQLSSFHQKYTCWNLKLKNGKLSCRLSGGVTDLDSLTNDFSSLVKILA